MSIAAKQRLIKNITSKLEDVMTINEINNLIEICTKEFTTFEINEKSDVNADIDSRELLESFLSAKTLEGRSINTIKRYRYVIERTLKTINTPIRDITVFHLRQYLISEQ